MLDRITPLILTYNEAPNISRMLASLAWAGRVVVLDSGSSDATQEIVSAFPNAVLFTRPFDGQAAQWNFGLLKTGIDTEWALALDADYGLSPSFIEELGRLVPSAAVAGYRARFRYCIDGVPLRGGIYPSVTVLYRRQGARYVQDGHTQRIQVAGEIAELNEVLLHDDRKPIHRWFASQIGYMRQEAAHLVETPAHDLRLPDRIRRHLVFAPALVFFYCLIAKGGLLDGRRGLFYALQRSAAEVILSIFLIEAGLRQRANGR